MKMNHLSKIILVFSLGLLTACGGSPHVEAEHVIAPPVDSAVADDLSVAIVDSVSIVKLVTSATINQFIHPVKGLWLIQSSGAMPSMTNTTQVDKNFPVDFSTSQNRELPKVACASKTFWTKEGCFVQEVNAFKSEKIWMHCSLSEKEQAVIEEIAKTIRLTAINTSFSARYYFSMIDGKWYLTFVDLRRPCEA